MSSRGAQRRGTCTSLAPVQIPRFARDDRQNSTAMLIRFKRHPDGSASLTCVRGDGTSTWQRQQGQLGLVFPPHDLTHYAVETTLGYRHGFYGLIEDGWNIEDFAKPWPRGPIPDEAQEVE